jgi:hypothetical protein
LQRELERLFARLVAGPDLNARDPAAIRAFLSESALSADDIEALEADFEKLWVYRGLVRATLREAIELAIPRSVARLGRLFDEYFERFLAEAGPRSPYLRDVTAEFLSFAGPLFRADQRIPPYVLDLARHEALRISIGAMPAARRGDAPDEALALDRGVELTEACALMDYDFAVHRLSEDEADLGEPVRERTHLFVYRSPEHEVRYLELTPLAFSILARLLAGETLESAIRGATTERGVVLDASVLEGTARLLADLAERGALFGPRSEKENVKLVVNPAPSSGP